MDDKHRTRDVLITSITPILWGSSYLVTTEMLPPDRPLLGGLLRALPAGLMLLLITRVFPSGVWWGRAIVLGLLNIGLFYPLLFLAAYRLPGGVAATLGAAQPLVVALLAWLILNQRPTAWHLVWGVVGVLGVGLLVLTSEARLDPLGLAAGLIGTSLMSVGVILMKKWPRPVGVFAFTGWQLVVGGLALIPLTLLVEGLPTSLDAKALAGYAYFAIAITLIGNTLFFRGIALLPIGPLSFLPLLTPLVAALLGWLALGQTFTLWQSAGFGLALAAITAAQLRSGAVPRREPSTDGSGIGDEVTPA